MHFFRELPSFFVLPQTKEIVGQLGFRRKEFRIERQRLALQRSTLRETIFLRKFSSDEVWHDGILWPRFHGRAPRFFLPFFVRANARENRAIGVCLRVLRIDFQSGSQGVARFVIIFGIDVVISEQEVRTDVVRIELQGLLESLDHCLAIARGIRPRQAEPDIRILGKFLGSSEKRLRGEGKIILVERQSAAGEIAFPEFGVLLSHGIKKQLENPLRVAADQQRDLSQRNTVHRGAISPFARPGQPFELEELRVRLLGSTGTSQSPVGVEPETEIEGKPCDRLDHGLPRLPVSSQLTQSAAEQERPFGLIRRFVHALRRLGDGSGIIAVNQQLPGRLEICRVRSR